MLSIENSDECEIKVLCLQCANETNMEIRQLRYFVNAATTLSFTEAARLSNVAQSTLSQQVKQLEIELGMPLFHRMGKHIQLTAEGQMFLQDAHRILDDARQGLQRLADQRELKGGSVDIGLASGLGLSSLLTDVLTEYNRSYPQVQLRIHQTAAPMLPELLRQHSIDLAMTFKPDAEEPDIDCRPLFASRLCAIVAEHNALASKTSINLSQIALHPLVLPSDNLYIRQRIDDEAQRLGIEVRPAVEIDDLSHIIYMVNSNRWVSILPDAATLAVRGIVRITLEEQIMLPTSVLTLADSYQRRAVTEFISRLREATNLHLQTQERTCDVCGETFLAPQSNTK